MNTSCDLQTQCLKTRGLKTVTVREGRTNLTAPSKESKEGGGCTREAGRPSLAQGALTARVVGPSRGAQTTAANNWRTKWPSLAQGALTTSTADGRKTRKRAGLVVVPRRSPTHDNHALLPEIDPAQWGQMRDYWG